MQRSNKWLYLYKLIKIWDNLETEIKPNEPMEEEEEITNE